MLCEIALPVRSASEPGSNGALAALDQNVAVTTMVAHETACPIREQCSRSRCPKLLKFDYSTVSVRARGEAGVETSAGPGHAT